MRLQVSTVALLTLLATTCANAQSASLYSNNFESSLGQPPWGTAAYLSNSPSFTNFVGRFSSSLSTILMLPVPSVPAGHTPTYTLTFDLFTIDRWDGTEGNDYFDIRVNDVNIFHESFSTTGAAQTFRAPDIGPAHLGFNSSYVDAIYRDISVSFTLQNPPHIWIVWDSTGLSQVNDSSWGVDNVRVSYTTVPAPAGAGLAIAAGLGLCQRKRRNCAR